MTARTTRLVVSAVLFALGVSLIVWPEKWVALLGGDPRE